ncbi:MAG: holo-ACP synthase [Actinomycetota bacterium]
MTGIGIDVVEVERLRRAVSAFPGFLDRVFTEEERRYSLSKPRPFEHLAARFAAKEAAFKSLGSGWPHLSWHDVEVRSGDSGPQLRVRGRAGELAGPCSWMVSLAHDGGIAIAEVVRVDGTASFGRDGRDG